MTPIEALQQQDIEQIRPGDLVRVCVNDPGRRTSAIDGNLMLVLQVAPICDLEVARWTSDWPAALVLRSDGSRKTYLIENLTLCEKAEENK